MMNFFITNHFNGITPGTKRNKCTKKYRRTGKMENWEKVNYLTISLQLPECVPLFIRRK